ncbi:MAG: heparan-alpha-glucosaminide N-acetyltransferase, partial [Acutalibacteraceae bacterium]|nr:heparan-alpha-glucosaminide N-acetyltransferase [Acutalibacteraceae bacterium]
MSTDIKKENKRICMLDELRGVAIIAMVIYHTLVSMALIYSLEFSYDIFLKAQKLQPLIPITFITLCGISCSLSKSNLKRGVRIFAIAMIVTLVTFLFMPQMVIVFGILHFLGLALIIYSLLKKYVDKIKISVGIVVSLLLYIITYSIPYGYIGFKSLLYFDLPSQLYSVYPLFILGLPTPDFYSGDYFPIVPHIFLFFTGIFIGKLLKEKGAPKLMYKKLCPPLDFIGKYSLVIYVAHQPVII